MTRRLDRSLASPYSHTDVLKRLLARGVWPKRNPQAEREAGAPALRRCTPISHRRDHLPGMMVQTHQGMESTG
jgi:hypothetical protein